MKVILVNGSPREKGCTYTALTECAKALEENGVETEIMWVGRDSFGGVYDYGALVDEFAAKAGEADGFVFGSPVYYAAATGIISMFLDKAFGAEAARARRLTSLTSISR